LEGASDGTLEGTSEGRLDGMSGGRNEGASDGDSDGLVDGASDGTLDGASEGRKLGMSLICTPWLLLGPADDAEAGSTHTTGDRRSLGTTLGDRVGWTRCGVMDLHSTG